MRFGHFTVKAVAIATAGFLAWGVWAAVRGRPPVVAQPITPTKPTETVVVPPTIPRDPKAAEEVLTNRLGNTVKEIIQDFGLADAEHFWVDEPTGSLRGIGFSLADKSELTLYFAESEPLYRKFNARLEWDFAAALPCRIDGIQYRHRVGEFHLDIGPAVPWQWRRR